MVKQTAGSPPRGIWAAIIMIAAMLVSCGVGLLSWLGGENGPDAAISAGAAFSGATVFGFAIFNFLTKDHG